MPYVCYIDEAGCSTPLPSPETNIQPVLVIGGLILNHACLAELTVEFLKLKRKYFPGKFKSAHPLDDVREEIKGSDIRSRIRKRFRRADTELKLLDEVLQLLKAKDAAIFASIWVKGVGAPFRARPIYTKSIQMACETFEEFLVARNDCGFIVGDFRTTQLNDQVAHSIFTQKYRAKGDPFGRILELPTFGVSNNHVGLQITDLLCSALLFPMATATYCLGHVKGVHVTKGDVYIKRRFSRRINKLQYRFIKDKMRRGGVWVRDAHEKRDSGHIFKLDLPGNANP